MTLLTLIACTSLDGTFLSGSGRFVPSRSGDTGDSAGDTAGSDTGTVGDDGAPVLVDASLTWQDYPEDGTVLVFSGTFTDEGDDIIGGTCFIDVYSDGEYLDDASLPLSDDSEDNDGQVCLVIGDVIGFAIPGLDASKSAGIDISFSDSSNNTSAEYTYETDAQ